MIVVVIPAKGHSSRLEGKNMRGLNGRPMIDYVIGHARACASADLICVSTDDDAIADHVAAQQGVRVVRRPPALGGETPLFDVYKHAAEQVGIDKIEILIGLQADHPDRRTTADRALAYFREQGADYMTSTDSEGAVNGAFKMYTRAMLESGEARKHVVIVDDCTNVHYEDDLARAAAYLAGQPSS